jgi:hypothetical protein
MEVKNMVDIRIDQDVITEKYELAECFQYIIEHTQRTIKKEEILEVFKNTLEYHF